MKNCAVAEFGSGVRAMAIVPAWFLSPAFTAPWASLTTGARVGFCLKLPAKPPPWIMKPSITRWNTVPL
jgi:hypothetical protein